MGLRTASARRPHVMVMAPALTKTSQSQSFKLSENNSPSSPATSLTTRSNDHGQFDPFDKDSSEKRYPFNHTDLVNATDNLNTLALVSELLKNNCCIGNYSNTGSSDVNVCDPSGIMNSSPLHMGDHKDKMGLQKAGLDINELIKDKSTSSDVDQLFNNIESDVGVSSDIVQNVDELMQVFKSIESGSDRLGGCTSELGTESDSIFPLSATDLPSNFSSLLEKELFNDVDVMNISMEEQLLDGASTYKENHTNEMLVDLQKKHSKLERKLEFMLRRLRKIQSQHMGRHISEQVAGVFEEVHRSLRHPRNNVQTDQSSLNYAPSVDPAINKLVYPEKLKPICRSSAKALVKKLKIATDSQANSIVKQRQGPQYFGSGSTDKHSSYIRKSLVGVTTVPQWSPEHKLDLQKVTGLLHTETKLVQQDIDSEATVSSSGGESCDEMQTYNNSQQQYLIITKRAAWRYAKERAAVASRWTWLKAQILDLEYRIRQYSDLYKQIRSSKGNVTLGGRSPQQSISPSSSAVNGYLGQLPGATSKTLDSTSNGALTTNDVQCSRTRPLIAFRKRKLLQTWGLHAVSKKAARPATIRCGCVPPNLQCALCTGRTDPTRPRDHPDYLSKSERVSLLDPSFHPVFSLREDTSASIHLEAIMRTLDWQQKSSKPNVKAVKFLAKGTDKFNLSGDHQPKKQPSDHRRKYNRLIKPSTINALTAKIKNKLRGRKPGLHTLSRLRRKRHSEKLALSHLQVPTESVNEEVDNINFGNKVEMRCSSPSMQTIPNYKRSSRVSSYDIDNIVIPYSVAASTRVEKLPYKEILTPKWRIIDPESGIKYKNNGVVVEEEEEVVEQQPEESDNEDLLEESVVLRHDKCEHDEKKKFLSYLKFPYGYGRSRAHKRTDSQAESSGCNTPDPLSPHAGENLENVVSPITSPPVTPLNVNIEDTAMVSSSTVLRRRTTSQSKPKDKEMLREEMCLSATEHIEVFPYDRRFFPLSEDTYDKMLKLMPENHQFKTNYRAQDCTSPSSFLRDRVNSPDSESTESAVGDEDPNDPEWIDMETIKERYRR